MADWLNPVGDFDDKTASGRGWEGINH